MKLLSAFIAQQDNAISEHLAFTQKLLATGKCQLNIPPDCFIWTGTREELEELFKDYERTIQPR